MLLIEKQPNMRKDGIKTKPTLNYAKTRGGLFFRAGWDKILPFMSF